MTATPLRDDNRDTYLYFGNPIFEYSLRQGIDDGFLAPYRVHRVVTEWDAAGWRPSKGDFDRYGRPIPDEEYETKDFERAVALRARTDAIARHLTEFLKKSGDRFAKTIVFCVDQEHASDMRTALNNLNADLVAQHPDYVCRVTKRCNHEQQLIIGNASAPKLYLRDDGPLNIPACQLKLPGEIRLGPAFFLPQPADLEAKSIANDRFFIFWSCHYWHLTVAARRVQHGCQ